MPSTSLLEHYRRLLSLPWGGRDSAGSVGTCGQSGTSSCRVPAAQQERGRLGGLRRAPLDGMASSSNAFVHCHVVFSDGNVSGKKNGLLRCRYPRSATASRCSFTRRVHAGRCHACCMNAKGVCNATSLHASITGNSVTVWLH